MEEWLRKDEAAATGEAEPRKLRLPNLKNRGTWLLIAAAALGLLALLWPTAGAELPAPAPPVSAADNSDARQRLARELEEILSAVEGAGAVQVSVTLASEGERVYARDLREEERHTLESDSSGGERDTLEHSRQSEIALAASEALLLEQRPPVIAGVLVLAEGAADARLREQLTDLTATLLDISPHQVRVAARKGNE